MPGTPAEKQKRIQKAMSVAQAILAEADQIGIASPKLALSMVLSAEAILDRYPSRDLEAFDRKRAHNDLVTTLAKKRAALEAEKEVGPEFTADARFAKQAVEALFAQASRDEEIRRFDLSALAKLPVEPLQDLDRGLKKVAEEIETRLEKSRALDAKVQEWGWKNLGRLMLGLDPLEVPSSQTGAGMFGRLVGTGRASAVTAFKLLGDQFRERLYLIAANAVILPAISRMAQADEAWRKLVTKGAGDKRWDRIKQNEGLLLAYLVDPDPTLPQGIEQLVWKLGVKSPGVSIVALRAPEEIRGVEWEGWAKGYFLELEAISAGKNDSFEFSTRKLAKLLIEKRNGAPSPREKVAAVLADLNEAWRVAHGGGNPTA